MRAWTSVGATRLRFRENEHNVEQWPLPNVIGVQQETVHDVFVLPSQGIVP